MSKTSTMQLEEKELGLCVIPISEDQDTMAVYIPKLMNSLPSSGMYEKEVTIDYSIIKNLKSTSKKSVKECNYLYTKPYLENNISPPLFAKGENCFVRFLYNDIKQPFFLSENTQNSSTEYREFDIQSISAVDGKVGKYTLELNTKDGYILLSTDNQQHGSNKNFIKIDQVEDSIILDTNDSNIKIEPSEINIESKKINFLGTVYINGTSLEEFIENLVSEKVSEILSSLEKSED